MDDPNKAYERQVSIWRPVRILLGLVVLAGALVFLLVAALLLTDDVARMPSPQGAIVLALFLVLFGLGLGFIGVRLVKMKEANDYLFDVRAALVGGGLIAAFGIVIVASAIYFGERGAISTGLVIVLAGFALNRAGRRRKAALERSRANVEVPGPPGAMGAAGPAAASMSRARILGWTIAIVVLVAAIVLAVRAYRTVPSSRWMTFDDYQREFDTRSRQGFYPYEVEGECRRGSEKYRAFWKSIPSGAYFFAHHGMTRQDYERRLEEYRSKGFSLESVGRFRDCSGIERYQATWLKRRSST